MTDKYGNRNTPRNTRSNSYSAAKGKGTSASRSRSSAGKSAGAHSGGSRYQGSKKPAVRASSATSKKSGASSRSSRSARTNNSGSFSKVSSSSSSRSKTSSSYSRTSGRKTGRTSSGNTGSFSRVSGGNTGSFSRVSSGNTGSFSKVQGGSMTSRGKQASRKANSAVRASSADPKTARRTGLISAPSGNEGTRQQRKAARQQSRQQKKQGRTTAATRGANVVRGASAALSGGPSFKIKIVIAVVVVVVAFFGIDALLNNGKIHSGVSVAGLNVGGMTQAEAAQAIEQEFTPKISSDTIYMYASEDAMKANNVEPYAVTFDYETMQAFESEPPQSQVYSVTPSALGAYIDGEALAEQAYSIGRGSDFVLGRIRACTLGTSVDLKVDVDQTYLTALTGMLTNALGYAMVNPNIAFQDGQFVTTAGNDGYMVNDEKFESDITAAIMDGETQFVIPMENVKMQVSDEAAASAAETAQAAVQQPVTLLYSGSTWTLDSSVLGNATSTFVREGGWGGNTLVPYISVTKVEQLIPALDGMQNIGTPAQNVHFKYDGTQLTHTEATEGIGPNYPEIAEELNGIVYSDDNLLKESGEETESDEQSSSEKASGVEANYEQRQITMTLTTSYPTMTYADAESMHLTDGLIYSYSTNISDITSNKAHNIMTLADILTNTVIAPGETFSLNDTAGECNEEKGFLDAGSILNGEVVSEIGGGICQVATTVFNAVFNAGYPIVERHNHSNYVSSYPDGLDAAISWPYLDLKFTNDTNNYMLLLVDYDDEKVTCSLWGISPGRTVDYEMVEYSEGDEYKTVTRTDESLAAGREYVSVKGQNGHNTTIKRETFDATGKLLSTDYVYSVYQPKNEIILKGPDSSDSSSSSA